MFVQDNLFKLANSTIEHFPRSKFFTLFRLAVSRSAAVLALAIGVATLPGPASLRWSMVAIVSGWLIGQNSNLLRQHQSVPAARGDSSRLPVKAT